MLFNNAKIFIFLAGRGCDPRLGRLTGILYPASPAENVSYTYNDLNQLTQVSDPSGSRQFTYDTRGNPTGTTYGINGQGYSQAYHYDASGQLTGITYPSGQTVTYQLDNTGRPQKITTVLPGESTARTLIDNIAYSATGELTGFDYGNGVHYSLSHDDHYRLEQLTAHIGQNPLYGLDYAFDNSDNITHIIDQLQGGNSQSFTYDELYRLTQGSGPYGQIDYGYDAIGNRLNKTHTDTPNTLTETYTYQATTNRLDGIAFNDGTTTNQRNLTYDAVGNIVTDSRNGQTYNYIYNHANRRQSVTDGAQNPTTLASYVYNAFGERVVKSTGGSIQHAHYMDGLRLSETDQNGNAITEYIYLAGTPIAVIKNANQAIPAEDKLYYIVPDHLATPRVVLDQDQVIVWRQTSMPFGIADIDEDPDGDTQAFTLDARFPGQYWDQETQSSYNYFRDYDETLGRYLQSDPIGLDGGINTYSYVNQNPLSDTDSLGLLPNSMQMCMANPACASAFIGGGVGGIIAGASNAYQQSQSGCAFNWGSFASATAGGALSGAVSSAAFAGVFGAASKAWNAYRASKTTSALAVTHGLPNGLSISYHALLRMGQKGVSIRHLTMALRRGAPYYNPKHNTIQYVLTPTFGKNISVSYNPITKQITTVMRQWNKINTKQLVPLN